jgi:hypothetical protein
VRGLGEPLDGVQSAIPLPDELGHGAGGLIQAVCIHLVENLPTLLAAVDQPGVLEHDQVLGDRLARDRHLVGQPAGVRFTPADDEMPVPGAVCRAVARPAVRPVVCSLLVVSRCLYSCSKRWGCSSSKLASRHTARSTPAAST